MSPFPLHQYDLACQTGKEVDLPDPSEAPSSPPLDEEHSLLSVAVVVVSPALPPSSSPLSLLLAFYPLSSRLLLLAFIPSVLVSSSVSFDGVRI